MHMLIYESAKFVNNVLISLLEMSKVYDLVEQPWYVHVDSVIFISE